MAPAIYLFLSNTALPLPSSAKTWTAFLTSWPIILWTLVHLLANGDKAHVMLFGTFLFFAIISMYSGVQRGATKSALRPSLKAEFLTLTIAAIVYLVILFSHQYIAGVPIVL